MELNMESEYGVLSNKRISEIRKAQESLDLQRSNLPLKEAFMKFIEECDEDWGVYIADENDGL